MADICVIETVLRWRVGNKNLVKGAIVHAGSAKHWLVFDRAEGQKWGKNAANRTPNHAIQCPSCIYANTQKRALKPANTGFSARIHQIPQHNGRVLEWLIANS